MTDQYKPAQGNDQGEGDKRSTCRKAPNMPGLFSHTSAEDPSKFTASRGELQSLECFQVISNESILFPTRPSFDLRFARHGLRSS